MNKVIVGIIGLILNMVFLNHVKGQDEFITVKDGILLQGETAYHFLGTNFWYGMNLGIAGNDGDQERLKRELDHLKAMGVTNLRIMGASEGPDTEPFRVAPALQPSPGTYNEAVFKGLDYLLYEMGKRDMKAVVVLNNFWVWTGGMAQYNAWVDHNKIPYPPPAANGDWSTFQEYASSFYTNKKAIKIFNTFVKTLINRRNTYSGEIYKNDPVVMSWQLANEPRGYAAIPAYRKWIHNTAKRIKSLDKQHLVSIGSEGNTANEFAGTNFYEDHQSKYIDYATAHIWVQNWGWFSPERGEETLPEAISLAKQYLEEHIAAAKRLNMPLVIEEFGISRDKEDFNPDAPVTLRDQYFKAMFQYIYELAQQEKVLAGANFWSWAGEGRPRAPGEFWKPGDELIGDPPHESQGWYSVYDKDISTIQIITHYAELMHQLNK